MEDPKTILDLCEVLMPHEITHLNNSGRFKSEIQSIEVHYWTDEHGEHLVFDNEIPQPE